MFIVDFLPPAKAGLATAVTKQPRLEQSPGGYNDISVTLNNGPSSNSSENHTRTSSRVPVCVTINLED